MKYAARLALPVLMSAALLGATHPTPAPRFHYQPYLPPSPITPRSGTECNNPALAGVPSLPINPVSSGPVTQTFVELPLNPDPRVAYAPQMRNATRRSQFAQVCARR